MRGLVAFAIMSWVSVSVVRAQPAPDASSSASAGAPAPPPAGAPPPPPGAVPPPSAPPIDAPGHPDVPMGVIEDANSGRSWLSPTALTPPSGTWSFSDYELFSVGASYAITDHINVSATTVLPLVSDQPFVGMLTAKWQLLHLGRLHLAAQGALGFAAGDNDGFVVGTVGGVATLCIDLACGSHVSAYVGAGFGDSGDSTVPIIASLAIAGRVSRHVKLVGELDTGYLAGSGYNSWAGGFLFWYGLRFTSHNIGVDLGFMEPIVKEATYDPNTGAQTGTQYQVGFGYGFLPMGFPFVSFTYRTN